MIRTLAVAPVAAALAVAAVAAAANEPPPFVLAPLGPTAPAGAALPLRQAGLAPAMATGERTALRRPAVSAGDLMLQGEDVVRRLPLFLTAAEASRATGLSVGAITAVDVLETLSVLEVHINGHLVGTVRPRFDAPATLAARLEPGILVGGVNELMFVARHEHRVACTIGGTYELWTRLLPDLTGIVVPDAPATAVLLADLPSLLATNPDPSALAMGLPSPLDDRAATRLVRLLDAVVLNGWIARPSVRLAAERGEETAVRLALAATPPPGAIPFDDADGLHLVRGADGSAREIVLAGDAAAMDAAIGRLEAAAARRSTDGSARGVASLLALFGTELADRTAYTFGELGFDDLSFAGRHARVDLSTILPADFFKADYGDVSLLLDGGTLGPLAAGSVLKVKVNDVETVTLPLGSERPTRFSGDEIRIPLDRFDPGLNTVTIEAELLTDEDAACAPEAAPVTAARFELKASSRIATPTLARVGVAPNLAATFSHAYPHALATERPTTVFAVGDGGEAIAGAAAFLARMTANAQQAIPYEIALRRPTEAESGIIVGPASAMPAWAVRLLGTVEEPVPSTAEPVPPAAAERPDAPATDLVRQRFGTGSGDEGASLIDRVAASLPQRTEDLAEAAFANVGGIVRGIFGEDAAPQRHVYAPGDVVLAQALASRDPGLAAFEAAVLPGDPPRTWTVVAVPDAATLGIALEGSADGGVRFLPRGAHYAYSGTHDRAVEAGAGAALFATEPPGVVNLRLVAAGWLSYHPKVYVAIVTGLALAMGLLLFAVVGRGGARRGR